MTTIKTLNIRQPDRVGKRIGSRYPLPTIIGREFAYHRSLFANNDT